MGKNQMSISDHDYACRVGTTYEESEPATKVQTRAADSRSMLTGPCFDEVPPKWLPPLISRCYEMVQLEKNWDTYGAEPVSDSLAGAAIDMLCRLMRPETPAPQVVPTPSGGLQFEWHRKNNVLEVEFVSPHRMAVFYASPEEEWEREFTSDLTDLAKVFAQLD